MYQAVGEASKRFHDPNSPTNSPDEGEIISVTRCRDRESARQQGSHKKSFSSPRKHTGRNVEAALALRTFYRYLAIQQPEIVAAAQRVQAIPTNRTQAPETIYF